MDEREKIVAYLRAEARNAPGAFSMFADGMGGLMESPSARIGRLADNIENGLHLTFKPAPTIPFTEWRDKPSVG